jgi:heat shock protein HslJ
MLILFSCRSAKEMVSINALNGEWNIVEIKGAAVVPEADKPFPYIGFNASTGAVTGNSGCNRIVGSFDTSAKAGTIDLSKLAGTRMMCTDMRMEENVLNALKDVKGYMKMGNGRQMALTNKGGRPVMVLEPKE